VIGNFFIIKVTLHLNSNCRDTPSPFYPDDCVLRGYNSN